MFEINKRGANRLVILTKNYAFKFPSLHSWKNFLFGLLNNITEAKFGRSTLDGYCPVLFVVPGGFLNVMPRVRTFTEEEAKVFDFHAFCQRPDYVICAEYKADSFGYLNGKVVAVDYGWVI